MISRGVRIVVVGLVASATVLITAGVAQADEVYRLRQYETTYAVPR